MSLALKRTFVILNKMLCQHYPWCNSIQTGFGSATSSKCSANHTTSVEDKQWDNRTVATCFSNVWTCEFWVALFIYVFIIELLILVYFKCPFRAEHRKLATPVNALVCGRWTDGWIPCSYLPLLENTLLSTIVCASSHPLAHTGTCSTPSSASWVIDR